MKHEEGLFNGAGRLNLYYQCWLPEEETLAVVVIVHGFSDHCGRYDNLVEALVHRRMAVYSYDLRGHGRSPGKAGHVQHFADYRQDTHAFVAFTAAEQPHAPLFLFGHSMGGLIALDQALHYPEGLSAVIASAPHLGNPPLAPIKVQLGRLLSRIWPSFSMEAGLDVNAMSRDELAVRAYLDDPLVHGRGTARLAQELETAVAETQANAAQLQVPLLIYFGTEDRVTNPEDSLRFYNNVPGPDKTLVTYEGGYHENHNDIHHERVVIEVAQWIEARWSITARAHESQDKLDG